MRRSGFQNASLQYKRRLSRQTAAQTVEMAKLYTYLKVKNRCRHELGPKGWKELSFIKGASTTQEPNLNPIGWVEVAVF